MAWGLSLYTASEEPLGVDEAKDHLRVAADITDENAYIQSLVYAARQHVEQRTGKALLTQTWELRLDRFPCEIRLPRPPLQSVTSIKYVDTNGTEQTLATTEYQVDAYEEPARIREAYSKTWPTTRGQMNAVTIRYVAGFTAIGDPRLEPYRAAIKLLVAEMYEHREPVVTGTIVNALPVLDRLLAPVTCYWEFNY